MYELWWFAISTWFRLNLVIYDANCNDLHHNTLILNYFKILRIYTKITYTFLVLPYHFVSIFSHRGPTIRMKWQHQSLLPKRFRVDVLLCSHNTPMPQLIQHRIWVLDVIYSLYCWFGKKSYNLLYLVFRSLIQSDDSFKQSCFITPSNSPSKSVELASPI